MLLAAVSPSLMAGNIIRLSDGAILPGEPSPPVRTVVRSGPYTEVTYEFESYAVEPSADSPGSVLVTAPLFQVNHSQGEPAYLFKTDALNINDTTDVAIEIVDAQYTDLHLKLSPAPTLQMMNEDTPGQCEPIVGYDGFSPEQPVSELDRFVHRGQPVIRAYVTPVLYSDNDTVTRLYRRIKYRIYSGEGNEGIMTMSDGIAEDVSLEFDINHPVVYGGQLPINDSDVSRSCLIIAHSQYETGLSSFIEWKRTLGINTKAVYSNSWTVQSILTKHPNVKICIYGPTTIPYFAEIKNGAVVSTEDSNKGIQLSCENSGSATISIVLSGDVEGLNNPTIEVTDLAGYTTVSVPVAKESYSTVVITDGPGNYSVTLIDNGNIIESQKIQIR